MPQTQLELNDMAEKKYQKTWKELTLLQDRLLQKYKHQKDESNSIILGHKNWIKKRNFHMRQIDKEGSFFPVRWYKELNYLTKERIKFINRTYGNP